MVAESKFADRRAGRSDVGYRDERNPLQTR
jgi:hypothetical protein